MPSKVNRKDPAYLKRVRSLPCVLASTGRCWGRLDPHHAGKHPGVGLKAHDTTAIPLCRAHHDAWHDHRGHFEGWNCDHRRAWADEQIARTQAALGLAPAAGGSRAGVNLVLIDW